MTSILSKEKYSARFKYIQELKLDDFSYPSEPYGGLACRLLSSRPVQQQFDDFAQQVVSCSGSKYLPIYRMADGEFQFLVGLKRPLYKRDFFRNLLWEVKFRLKWNRKNFFETCWGERYFADEYRRARKVLGDSLRYIAQRGIIAPYFMKRRDQWSEEYFEPMSNWFEINSIDVNERNYVPFYFVYALLNGRMRSALFRDKNIVVVTNLTEERRRRITQGLHGEEAASVQFIYISRDKSMFDRIDVATIQTPVDMVLVAAGIGSANILVQLEALAVPCIDCGISLECWIDETKRYERPFLRDVNKIPDYWLLNNGASKLKF